MKLEDKDLSICAEKANELSEYYKTNARTDHIKKSLDDLIRFCKDYLGCPVILRDLEISSKPDTIFHGVMLPHKDGHYEIYVLQGHDEATRRLVTCKELFQVALDEKEARNLNLYDHITALVYQDMQTPTLAVVSEQMAEVAAMQFLYPYKDRLEDIRRIRDRELNTTQISEYYGIPLFYVEKYLTPNIMESLRGTHLMTVAALNSATA